MSPLAARNGSAIAQRSIETLAPGEFRETAIEAVRGGRRIVALFGRPVGQRTRICAVLADDAAGNLHAMETEVQDRFVSLTPDCPQAHYFEREIFEQHGVLPEGHPWLKPVRGHAGPYPFFAIDGEEVHDVAVGPVHAGIIDPGHFRLQCHGETVLHLEIHLGYQHRGVEAALAGATGARFALLCECIAGDTTIGHALAGAGTMEALAGCLPPPRAQAIRAVALELERIANHVGDLSALGGDVGFLPTTAWFGRLRGEFLNLLLELSGSRYGRGLIRPGGVAFDLTGAMQEDFARRIAVARDELRAVAGVFFGTPSLRARLEGTGSLTRQACDDLGLLGPAARACGAARDVRQDHPAGLWRETPWRAVTEKTGDVLARAQVRWRETEASLQLLLDLIPSLPGGELRAACGAPAPASLAVSMVEGWRGEIAHVAVTGEDGRLARCKVKDPSFQNWTGLALALRRMQVSDFPLCNKSFNLSYAGHDL